MKAKVLVQILIIAILGTTTVQAQENINREVKKEMRKVKRELRKAKKEIRGNVDAIHLKIGDFDDDVIVFSDGRLDDLEDMIQDLDFDIPEIDVDIDFDDFDVIDEIDVRTPRAYKYQNYFSEQSSVLELSKDLEDVSISKDFFFEVKEGAENLTMNIDGTLESGDLTITVKKPDGEVFQKFQISPLADVDWSQQLELDEEGTAYTGKWTINLSGNGATGNYSLKFRTK